MSILINGMDMPKDCLKCPFCLFADGYWKCLVDGSHADFGGACRPSLCPLIPVPSHGDLIEESKVLDIVFEWCPDDDGSVGKDGDLREMLDEIEALPTIIPADEMI